jgi:hypothetical protein
MIEIICFYQKSNDHDNISFKSEKSDFTMILWGNRIIKRARNGYMSVEETNKELKQLREKQKHLIVSDLFENAAFWSGEPI